MTALHEALFRSVDIGMSLWRVDASATHDVVLVEANAAAARLLGRELPVGSPLTSVLPDHGAIVALAYAASTGAPLRIPNVQVARRRVVEIEMKPVAAGHVAITMVDTTASEETRVRLDHMLSHDPLTELENRDAFVRRLDEAVTGGDRERLAVVLLDLDHFNEINDTLGHRQGDLILHQVARRLERLPGPVRAVCRVAGDEFALLVPVEDARLDEVAARVARSFSSPFVAGQLAVRVTASVGVSGYPDHGTDADQLLRQADVAMWLAKRAPRGVAVYNAHEDRFNMRRLTLISELRDAIYNGELELHFQPKIDLATKHVKGAEALLRWNHPTLGPVSPAEFIPMAEESALIGPLTAWVIDRAARQCRRWLDSGHDLSVAANISARNLYDPNLVRVLTKVIDDQALDPGRLTLELTETQMAEDLPMARTLLRRLQALGARVSMDDFGTGYSSLAYLSRLPLDELKIDRSFVGELTSDQGTTVVQSIIGLGHDLGLHVVAEGVETAGTIDRLESLGCDEIQGHHVSKALAPDAFESWLATASFAA
ncbi:MAG TPA: EAL domain-containing protein [Acidimicrobiales bacterium]|nr:EAL domain-containing protein [Acidimicrobiales bacterium]